VHFANFANVKMLGKINVDAGKRSEDETLGVEAERKE
jgi:hypothetical protein